MHKYKLSRKYKGIFKIYKLPMDMPEHTMDRIPMILKIYRAMFIVYIHTICVNTTQIC
jgi:hypothetical protein